MANIPETIVVKKINQILRPMGEVLRNSFNHQHNSDLGDYYIAQLTSGKWVQTHIDLRGLALELDVIDEDDCIVEP